MPQSDFTRIASNVGALTSLYSLRKTNNLLGMHQTRLATGKRINSAEEDPAGLGIGTKMGARSEGLKVALDNIGDAKNMLSVGEAGLQRVNDILVQMRSKAEAAANDTLGASERDAIESQLNQFAEEIDTIVAETKWNGNKLLDGLTAWAAQGSKIIFQTGANEGETTELTATNFGNISTAAMNLATVPATSAVVEGTDADNVFSAWTAGATLFAGMSELGNGTYTFNVHIGTADGSTADSTIEILDAAGAPVQVDGDGTDGGAQAAQLTFAYNTAAAKVLDFGNGLQVTLAAGEAASADLTGTAAYTKAGTYSTDVGSNASAAAYMTTVDAALSGISSRLSTIGSLMARLTFKEEYVSVAQVNTEAAYNRIMNADMAFEQVESTKFTILQQTSMAMLSQANQAPQGVLSLFR